MLRGIFRITPTTRGNRRSPSGGMAVNKQHSVGHDTTLARSLLAQFQYTQVVHIAHRDELKKVFEA
jgi:hypothetical protein